MKNVLIVDIETSPIIAYVWGRKEQYIGTNQIHSDWHLLSYAAKKLGVNKSYYNDQSKAKDITDDNPLLIELHKLLDWADIVITQNGKNFDGPKINARFIMNGMNPPSPYKHLDTYQIARRVAAFTANSLEYLTDKLCTKYKKLGHKKFPGMELWKACMAGNQEAWAEMRKYNIHDVLATEELYMKLRAWAPDTMPKAFGDGAPDLDCLTCGEKSLVRQGFRLLKTGKRKRYSCTKCGSWQTGELCKKDS